MTKKEFALAICPSGDRIRGIGEVMLDLGFTAKNSDLVFGTMIQTIIITILSFVRNGLAS